MDKYATDRIENYVEEIKKLREAGNALHPGWTKRIDAITADLNAAFRDLSFGFIEVRGVSTCANAGLPPEASIKIICMDLIAGKPKHLSNIAMTLDPADCKIHVRRLSSNGQSSDELAVFGIDPPASDAELTKVLVDHAIDCVRARDLRPPS